MRIGPGKGVTFIKERREFNKFTNNKDFTILEVERDQDGFLVSFEEKQQNVKKKPAPKSK